MNSIFLTVEIKGVICGACGIPFGIESHHLDKLQQTGTSFYCPNGHDISYSDSENTKLKKKLEKAEIDTTWLRARNQEIYKSREKIERRLSATKGAVTRIKNRIKNGVCPCCSRSFQNLKSHMKTKHPNYCETEMAE